jgi:hypothetical protein
MSTNNVFPILLLLVGSFKLTVSNYAPQGSCTPARQRSVFSRVASCETRQTLVDLREHLSNVSNVIHVIPDVEAVARCGGSCERASHRCVATQTRTKRIEVIVVKAPQYPSTMTETECGVVEVEEHVACACDCPVSAGQCRARDQYYDPASCRCLCSDQTGRNACITRGMRWDPSNCMCVCPASTWRVCSTGYVFDFASTCSCVSLLSTAGPHVYAALLGVVVISTLTITSLVMFYNKRMRWFKQQLLVASRDSLNAHNDSDDEEEISDCHALKQLNGQQA